MQQVCTTGTLGVWADATHGATQMKELHAGVDHMIFWGAILVGMVCAVLILVTWVLGS